MRILLSCIACLVLTGVCYAEKSDLPAKDEARLLRFPTIHGNRLVFTYAGDLYTVAADGGVARRLTGPRRLRDVSALLAGWQVARLHRPVRRQHRGLRHAGRRRRAETTHLDCHPRPRRRLRSHGTEQHRHGLEARQQNHRLSQPHAVVQRFPRPALHRHDRQRLAGAVAVAARRFLLFLARRQQARLQPRLPRVPHLEALSRRHGRQRLAARLQNETDRQPDRGRFAEHLPDVARRQDLLPLRPRRRQADEPLRRSTCATGRRAGSPTSASSTSSSRRSATRPSSSSTAAGSIASTWRARRPSACRSRSWKIAPGRAPG